MILIDIPHGGTCVPEEVIPYIHREFSRADLVLDSDEFVHDVFLLNSLSFPVVVGKYWRAFIDCNRHEGDFSNDGIVKTHTSQGKQIYDSEFGLPEDLRQLLVDKYFMPYKRTLEGYIQRDDIRYVLFCHTMSGYYLPNSEYADDDHTLRPLFCLVNEGDSQGNTRLTRADRGLLEDVKKIIMQNLHLFDLDFNYAGEVLFNYPFSIFGSRFPGHVLKHKYVFSIEINRELLRKSLMNIFLCQDLFREILAYLEKRKV